MNIVAENLDVEDQMLFHASRSPINRMRQVSISCMMPSIKAPPPEMTEHESCTVVEAILKQKGQWLGRNRRLHEQNQPRLQTKKMQMSNQTRWRTGIPSFCKLKLHPESRQDHCDQRVEVPEWIACPWCNVFVAGDFTAVAP